MIRRKNFLEPTGGQQRTTGVNRCEPAFVFQNSFGDLPGMVKERSQIR
jgi:hypothetical protein